LLSELAELDALDTQTTKQGTAVNAPYKVDSANIHFPSAPSTKVEVNPGKLSAETDEEREIRELEASMLA
jgi:hypothetical protein